MKHKTRLLPLAGLLLAGGILCTGCGGAAPAQPDNYADAMALDNLKNVSPEGNIMDLSPLDPYASLYFNICG